MAFRARLLNKRATDDPNKESIWTGQSPWDEMQAMSSITPSDKAHYTKRTMAAEEAKNALKEALRYIGSYKENNDVLEKAIRILDCYAIPVAAFPPVKKEGPIFT